jgi:Spy/CpxP family protein refolding chaperone
MTLSGRSATVVVIGGIASLCLSLFLVGLLVGGLWYGEPHRPWGGHPPFHDGPPHDEAGRGGRGMMGVPPEIRAELKNILAPHEADIEKQRAAMHEARMAVGKALAADPFDPDAFKTALENMHQQGEAMQKLMHDLMLEAVPKLKPESRQRWAQRWMAPRMDGPPPPPPSDAPAQ